MNKEALRELRERVESAQRGSRDLDREFDELFDPERLGAMTPVSSSIDAAFALVSRCLPNWNWALNDRFTCVLRPIPAKDEAGSWGNWREASAKTAPLAVCAALLSALEAQAE